MKNKKDKNNKFLQFNFSLKNKKGQTFLGEKTLGIFIAVLCVIFLVYLLVSVYFSVTRSDKSEQAKTILDGSNGIINTIKKGEASSEVLVANPVGWYLFGFTETKPNSCLGENCICICEKAGDVAKFFNKNAQIEKCDTKKGVCSVVPNLETSFEIEIKKGELTTIKITQLNEKVNVA